MARRKRKTEEPADSTAVLEEEEAMEAGDAPAPMADAPVPGARYLNMTMSELLQAGNEQQAQAQRRANGHGIRCPRCHCADTRVWYTRSENGRVKRVRVCRHCARKILTHENTI